MTFTLIIFSQTTVFLEEFFVTSNQWQANCKIYLKKSIKKVSWKNLGNQN